MKCNHRTKWSSYACVNALGYLIHFNRKNLPWISSCWCCCCSQYTSTQAVLLRWQRDFNDGIGLLASSLSESCRILSQCLCARNKIWSNLNFARSFLFGNFYRPNCKYTRGTRECYTMMAFQVELKASKGIPSSRNGNACKCKCVRCCKLLAFVCVAYPSQQPQQTENV